MHFFVNNVVHPMMEVLENRQFRTILETFDSCQYMTQHDMKCRQEEKLRALIHHAYRNVSFYRGKMDQRGLNPGSITSIEDLSKLPIVSKKEMREHFPDKLVAENVSKKRFILDRTSGSTGEPLNFYRDIGPE